MQNIHVFVYPMMLTNTIEILKKPKLVFSAFHGQKGFLLLVLFGFFRVVFGTLVTSKTR